ncbi:AfsR/SARP family transcriptional regulator [Fodinicola acaciae]|uniref:AfsR/SARP family transcriptional regulator n=1 Tax=Fodinicola acaciae TaxID=2681555 RepID=UPI0013D8D6C1|nr:AfsR/SARP family transcriptional regulator [Fodinicola acaciae]
MAARQLVISVLGPFELSVDDRPLPMSGKRLRALLTSLALSAQRVVPIMTLTELVWDEQPPIRPRASLQSLVNRLRACIDSTVIRTEPHGYLLDVDPLSVDAVRFQSLVMEAKTAGRSLERPMLDEALALWRGEPLVDTGSLRLRNEAGPGLAEKYLAAFERRVDLDLEEGNYATIVADLQDMIARFPHREPLWVRLITALDLTGRPAEALKAYDYVRGRLADELGCDPSGELQSVYRRILQAERVRQYAPELLRNSQPNGDRIR